MADARMDGRIAKMNDRHIMEQQKQSDGGLLAVALAIGIGLGVAVGCGLATGFGDPRGYGIGIGIGVATAFIIFSLMRKKRS